MRSAERGIACPGCPHRAAFVAVKQAVGRGRGRVYCGDAGCPVVGAMHPAALAVEGGESALLDRYRQAVPDGSDESRARICAHFVTDRALASEAAERELDHLALEAETVLLCVLASSRSSMTEEAASALVDRAIELGGGDAFVLDPFDTLSCEQALGELSERAGVHTVVFASPCARLGKGDGLEPVEIDPYACVGCHRCKQITGCPAIVFAPPVYAIDADACAGCDLCADYCRDHVIYSPRQRMSVEERREARYTRAE